jgi:hypothetical protein
MEFWEALNSSTSWQARFKLIVTIVNVVSATSIEKLLEFHMKITLFLRMVKSSFCFLKMFLNMPFLQGGNIILRTLIYFEILWSTSMYFECTLKYKSMMFPPCFSFLIDSSFARWYCINCSVYVEPPTTNLILF